MHPDGIAMHAAGRLARDFLLRTAAHVAQDQLIRGQRDGLPDGRRGHAFRQCRGSRGGGLRWSGLENGLAELIHPGVLCFPFAGRPAQQLVFFEQLRQQLTRLAV